MEFSVLKGEISLLWPDLFLAQTLSLAVSALQKGLPHVLVLRQTRTVGHSLVSRDVMHLFRAININVGCVLCLLTDLSTHMVSL